MITGLLAAAAILSEPFEVPARPLAWTELAGGVFDVRWMLPERPHEGPDLPAEMRSLTATRFQLEVNGERSMRSLGDLLGEARELEREARVAWLSGLRERAPALMASRGAELEQLLLDDHLFSDRWDPKADHPRDGILTEPGWELGRGQGTPWNEVGVDVRFEQAAVLIHADLASIKAVENDYRTYSRHLGSSYEAIYPLDGAHFRGLDDAGRPFSALAIQFRCDLPFPFSHYDCRLQILNHFERDGTPRTDIYSTSPDFHYLAGRDVFLPVATSAGDRVAWLVVREFGFDLDDVPDNARHRAAAIRGSLGNLKRKAERLVARRASLPDDARESFTSFRVLGAK